MHIYKRGAYMQAACVHAMRVYLGMYLTNIVYISYISNILHVDAITYEKNKCEHGGCLPRLTAREPDMCSVYVSYLDM